MRLGYWAAALAMAGGVSVTAIALSSVAANEPVPSGLTEAGRWRPEPFTSPVEANLVVPHAVSAVSASPTSALAPALPTAAAANAPLPVIKPPLAVWSREIASGIRSTAYSPKPASPGRTVRRRRWRSPQNMICVACVLATF